MSANQRHPDDVAVWHLDEEGEVEDLDSYTNWPDQ